MNWIDILNQMKKERGLTTDEIVEKSGIPKGTLNKLFAGQTKDPQLSTIRQLVHSMGYKLDDLEDETATCQQPPHYDDLLDEYRAIIDAASEAAYKAQSLAVRAALTATPDELTAYRAIRKSEQGFSAGHGVYLGPEAFNEIKVKDNDLTHRATFCGAVDGDSMEPKYHDGDILLVDSDEEVEIGEIGIFTLDGNGYVKKRGHRELISLNPEYAPIPLDDSIRPNGKVIGVLPAEWILAE